LHRVLDNLPNAQLDALYVPADAVFTNNLKEIADFARTHRLPAFSSIPQFAKLGGLASYTYSRTEMDRNAADYVDRILNGAKAGDLPFVQPTRLELGLNRATARALGITIPADVLLRADFVVD
jgi:putative ABC transport system substrate-binding protein